MRVLLLNASYEPICVVSARRAVLLLMDEKVEVVEDGPDNRIFHSKYLAFHIPSVVRLVRYVKIPRTRSIPLNTRTVLARDRHRCAYCGEKATTMDHVNPRARGGVHRWQNVVASCHKCNNKKDDRSLEEMGWTLLIKPKAPVGAIASIVAFGGNVDVEWEQYLPQIAAGAR
jgi:5-methylcytosine-specific restriction endonuclease McrA